MGSEQKNVCGTVSGLKYSGSFLCRGFCSIRLQPHFQDKVWGDYREENIKHTMDLSLRALFLHSISPFYKFLLGASVEAF